MIENPQVLVPKVKLTSSPQDAQSLDAIFIPFRKRYSYINDILRELIWYKNPIFLMPSKPEDMDNIHYIDLPNIYELRVREAPFFIEFFNGLLTTTHRLTTYRADSWDLPLKRNYALWYSIRERFEKILLVDDDIRGLSPQIVGAGCELIDSYSIAGSFIEYFPDTSVAGHLQCALGAKPYCFLSGNFLFVRVDDIESFFPNIYNDDWLFMFPYINRGLACSFGSVVQEPYDPIGDLNTPSFQEFGEIIAEGLYMLVKLGLLNSRYELEFWNSEIMARKELLLSLKESVLGRKARMAIDIALKTNSLVKATDCLQYVNIWEDDLLTWQNFIDR